MPPILPKRILVILAFLTLFLGLSAQENEGLHVAKILKNSTYTFSLESSLPVQIIDFVDFPDNIVGSNGLGNNLYEIEFSTTNDFVGKEKFIYKYFSGPAGQSTPAYVTFEIEVVSSLVDAEDDFKMYNAGAGSVLVDILSNDSTTADSIQEIVIAQVTKGSASINANNQLVFVPDATSNVLAFVEYVIIDNEGNSDLATVIIQSDDVIPVDTMRFTITNENYFDIILPDDACTIVDSTLFGDLEITGTRMTYIPDAGSSGLDNALISDGSNTTFVELNVLDKPNPNGFVKDDYVFLAMNSSIDFNVFANDFDDSDAYIVAHSPQLTHDTLGQFNFTPSTWYQGERKFYYTAYNGHEHQTAYIYVSVSNHVPQTLTDYELTGLKNVPLVLNYEVPISDYHFEVLNAPANGAIAVNLDSFNYDCNSIHTSDLIVYQPNNDFVGPDEFDLKYFVNGQGASILKVKINIEDNTQNSLCHCVGPDCVWPGDTNNDGRVFVDDLLPIGLYMGQNGNTRSDIAYTHWNGQASSDWDETQGAFGADVKFVDADGNGIVTEEDRDEIINNYDGAHNLFTNQILGNKEFGLQFINLNGVDTIYEGETLCLGLEIGSETFPMIDMHGLAFGMNIDPDKIDSSSLSVNFYDNSWFTYNSAQIEMAVQPFDGVIDLALSRSDGNARAGHGIIGEACFIVEEDILGIRGDDDNNKILISSNNITSLGIDGNSFALQNASIEIPMGSKRPDDLVLSEKDLIVFPNPSSGIVNVHLNGDAIQAVNILNLQGQLMERLELEIPESKISYDVSSRSSGLYILQVETADRKLSKLLKIFSE